MKTILSPSKTQDNCAASSGRRKPLLNERLALDLFAIMKMKPKESLGLEMKIKGRLLDETYELYHKFDPFNGTVRAINCYKGVVFNEIETGEYDESHLSYMNSHLAILSAMYGVLEPDTSIWPYRLDMNVKPGGSSLYGYWQEDVDRYFANEDVIVNLASDEFSKMIKSNRDRMIHVRFYDEQADGRLKTVSYNAKKARGMMAHKLILEKVEDAGEIRNICIEGYVFDEAASDKSNYSFIRQYK